MAGDESQSDRGDCQAEVHLRVTLNRRNSAILRLRLVGLQPTPLSATSFNWWVGEADDDQAGFSRTSRLVFRHHHAHADPFAKPWGGNG